TVRRPTVENGAGVSNASKNDDRKLRRTAKYTLRRPSPSSGPLAGRPRTCWNSVKYTGTEGPYIVGVSRPDTFKIESRIASPSNRLRRARFRSRLPAAASSGFASGVDAIVQARVNPKARISF